MGDDPALARRAMARQRWARWLAHAALALGVLVFAFPIWITLVGSTHDAATIGRGDVPLLPGGHALENYATAWNSGGGTLRCMPRKRRRRWVRRCSPCRIRAASSLIPMVSIRKRSTG